MKKLNFENDKEVRTQLETVLKLRREFKSAQVNVGRIGKLGQAAQKKLDNLLAGKAE